MPSTPSQRRRRDGSFFLKTSFGKRLTTRIIDTKFSAGLSSSVGFSMIEVLIAIFIFSIVISTIFGSFKAVFFNSDRLSKAMTLHEMASNSLAQISQDLYNFHTQLPPFYKKPDIDDDPNPYRIVGDDSDVGIREDSRLRFTSLNHISFRGDKRQGVSEIIYYLFPGKEDEIVLKRADNLYPYPEEFEPSQKDPTLCEQVRAFKLTYINHDDDEEDDWDSENDSFKYSTPKAIKIFLEVGDDNYSVKMQTMVALPLYREERE